VLCTGIAVQDIVLRVPGFPPPGGKVMASDLMTITGGCAVNAAIAVARLGGRAHYAGPMGSVDDPVSKQLVAEMQREGVGIAGVVRVDGAKAPVSGIMIVAAGERMIATYRDRRVEAARAADPDALVSGMDVVLADNRYPDFVRPICEAARRRGIKVVLDADRPTAAGDPLFAIPTHVVFSAECLRETAGTPDLAAALAAFVPRTRAFLAVSNGPDAILYIAGGDPRPLPVFKVDAIDTLAAGDVFHAGFALALAEGRDEVAALWFGAAAAGLKCTRFGGSMGAPRRAEVEEFLAKRG
jgi:sugar/nucleoside kinase (ribokinase family)